MVYSKHREIRSKDNKLEVTDIPESPEECKFCMGPIKENGVLFECCFIDPECPTPNSKMVCSLSRHGYCNMLKKV